MEFLKDLQNWEILSGIVGLVSLLIGGGIVLKKRIRTTTVSAKNESVAAGRDINIGGDVKRPSEGRTWKR